MMTLKPLSLLLLSCSLILSANAWTQILVNHCGVNRILSSRLRLSKDGGAFSNEEIHNFREQLEQSFSEQVGLDEDDYLPYDSSEYGFDVVVCDGDCEQCEIPEDLKILPNVQPQDVMRFLGISRAEPLRVERERDWE